MNPSAQIPGSRQIFKGLFTFFSCFDDIFLYIYHERHYDIAVTFFFITIQRYEKLKWGFIPIEQF